MTRWGGIIAPPSFIDCIAPTFTQDRTNLPPGVRAFPAGAKRQFFKVIRPGDRIRVLEQFVGVEEKKHKDDKPYRMFLENNRRTYINQREEIVATADCRMVMPVFHRFEDQGAAFDQTLTKPDILRNNWMQFTSPTSRKNRAVLRHFSGRMLTLATS